MAYENIGKNSHVWIILSGIFSGIIFGIFGYTMGLSQSKISTVQEPTEIVQLVPSDPPAQKVPEIEEWKTYTNKSNIYSIMYPLDWRIDPQDNGEGFGPIEVGEDTYWGVFAYTKSDYSLVEVLDQFGNQFPDREQTKEQIDINGETATKVVTTTKNNPNWKLTSLVVEAPTSYIVITDGAVLSLSKDFEKFYKSFKLIK